MIFLGQQYWAVLANAGLTIFAASFAHAASFTSAASGTNWNDAAAWTAGAGSPGAGDSVTISHTRNMNNGYREFGTSSQASTWSGGNWDMDDDSLTHSGNSTLNYTGSGLIMGLLSSPKGWSFSNKVGSIFSHDAADTMTITCGLNGTDQGGFVNEGTYRFTAAGTLSIARSAWFKNIGTLVNESGGTVAINNAAHETATFSNGTAGVVTSIGSGSIISLISQNHHFGGTYRALTNSEIRLDPTLTPGAVLSIASGTVFQGDAASTGVVHISGDWGIDVLGVASGNVVIGQIALFTLPTSVPNIAINMDASGASGGTGANPTPGTVVLRGTIGVGTNTITLNTPASMGDGTLNINAFVSGGGKNGTFVNAAGNTFTHSSASTFNIVCVSNGEGTKFRNDGTYVFTVHEGDLDCTSALGNQIINAASGVIRVDVGAGNLARITGGSGAPLNNLGTLEALTGELDVQSVMSVVQLDGASLTGGTWDVTSTLDLNPANTLGINTIGAGATVRLRGTNAWFKELKGNLLTNTGTFGNYAGHVYDARANFVTPGVLEFGLRDADASQTAVFTGISNITAATLTGGTVDVVDLGLTENNTFTLLSFDSSVGALSIGNVPDNDFVYELVHNANNVQLKVAPPPAGSVLQIR
jgi:hypothetical protein